MLELTQVHLKCYLAHLVTKLAHLVSSRSKYPWKSANEAFFLHLDIVNVTFDYRFKFMPTTMLT